MKNKYVYGYGNTDCIYGYGPLRKYLTPMNLEDAEKAAARLRNFKRAKAYIYKLVPVAAYVVGPDGVELVEDQEMKGVGE